MTDEKNVEVYPGNVLTERMLNLRSVLDDAKLLLNSKGVLSSQAEILLVTHHVRLLEVLCDGKVTTSLPTRHHK